MSILLSYIFALLLTILVEFFVAYLMKVRDGYSLLVISLINCLTNIPANILFSLFVQDTEWILLYMIIFAFLELIVFLVEGGLFSSLLKEEVKKPFLLSFVLNLSSCLVGILFSSLFL